MGGSGTWVGEHPAPLPRLLSGEKGRLPETLTLFASSQALSLTAQTIGQGEGSDKLL